MAEESSGVGRSSHDVMTRLISNREIYERAVCGIVPLARERLWIATADIKDMYVDAGGRDMVPGRCWTGC